MMDYFQRKKAHAKPGTETDTHEEPVSPVLSEEDEAFLHHITSGANDVPPPLPARHPQDHVLVGDSTGNNAQIALMNGAQNVPLPDSPRGGIEGGEHVKGKDKPKDGKKVWSFLRRDSRDKKRKSHAHPNEDGLVTPNEARKEEDEMTNVLEQLNLAAVNNRVFSVSKESQELLRKFTLVLKDLVNGVPTAYGDLESLLTNSDNQLQNTYKHLPSFMQKLIGELPSKFQGTLGPEILAAAAAAAEKPGSKTKYLNKGAGIASKLGLGTKVPGLKELVTKPGSVIGLLKAIMNALKVRFPAFMGMNVLWSLALFVLLFVFWYCHKRGRETRLEKERILTESEIAALEAKVAAEPATYYDPAIRTTTAPAGASIEEVHQGMRHAAIASPNQAAYAPGGSLARDSERRQESEYAHTPPALP